MNPFKDECTVSLSFRELVKVSFHENPRFVVSVFVCNSFFGPIHPQPGLALWSGCGEQGWWRASDSLTQWLRQSQTINFECFVDRNQDIWLPCIRNLSELIITPQWLDKLDRFVAEHDLKTCRHWHLNFCLEKGPQNTTLLATNFWESLWTVCMFENIKLQVSTKLKKKVVLMSSFSFGCRCVQRKYEYVLLFSVKPVRKPINR